MGIINWTYAGQKLREKPTWNHPTYSEIHNKRQQRNVRQILTRMILMSAASGNRTSLSAIVVYMLVNVKEHFSQQRDYSTYIMWRCWNVSVKCNNDINLHARRVRGTETDTLILRVLIITKKKKNRRKTRQWISHYDTLESRWKFISTYVSDVNTENEMKCQAQCMSKHCNKDTVKC